MAVEPNATMRDRSTARAPHDEKRAPASLRSAHGSIPPLRVVRQFAPADADLDELAEVIRLLLVTKAAGPKASQQGLE